MKKTVIVLLLVLITGAVFAEKYVIGIKGETFNFLGQNIVLVTDIITNGPAFQAGIQIGDWIFEIDNNIVVGLTFDDISQMIGIETNTVLTLGIKRNNVLSRYNIQRVPASSLSLENLMFNDGAMAGDGFFMTPEFSVDNTAPVLKGGISTRKLDKNSIEFIMIPEDNLTKDLWLDYYIYNNNIVITSSRIMIYRKGGYTNAVINLDGGVLVESDGQKINFQLDISKITNDRKNLGITVILSDNAGNRSVYYAR